MKVIYCVLVLLLLLFFPLGCDSQKGCQMPWDSGDVPEDAGVEVIKDAATEEAPETADAENKADAVKDKDATDEQGKGDTTE